MAGPVDATPPLALPAERLAARLETLAALDGLDEAAAERWREQLGEAGDLASAGEAERAWQALDAVAEGLDEAAREAADATLAGAERLDRAADAVAVGEAPPPESSTGEGGQAAPGSENAGVAAQLSPAERQALADEMRATAGFDRQLAAALRSGAPLDLEALRQAAAAAGLDESELAEHLAGRAGEGGGGGEPEAPGFGRGGIDRGRGDAPLTVKEASHDYGADFVDHALAPASLAALETSVVLSTDAARPTADPQAGPRGTLDGARPAGGAAFTQLVLPRHRAAVRRYFARPRP